MLRRLAMSMNPQGADGEEDLQDEALDREEIRICATAFACCRPGTPAD